MDHASRRDRLAARFTEVGIDGILVTRLVNVRYLTGFTGSNGQLLLTSAGAVFFTDSRYDEQSSREVPGIDHQVYKRDFRGEVAQACGRLGVARLGFEADGLTYRAFRDLDGAVNAELVPLEDLVERLRWSKDPEELAMMERAQEITDEAFDRLVGKLHEGVTERAAAFELEVAMRELGAERVGFDTILAFGENAAEPHHRPSDRALRRGDVIKLDFGCVVGGYHSDMTRTVAFGDLPEELAKVYGLVLRAQVAGIDAVRAGVEGSVPDEAARRIIGEEGYGERFGHSLGHGVGLEIHEGPSLRAEPSEVLPEAAVVTVEPGIYLPGVGGVRIEDMVVVTADGCRPLPRTTKELVVL